MKDCLVAPNLPEKPKVAPIIHERPKMPARTWSALRSHILTERKKKREEEGKQKEEERRKREREHRAKQEANNLEETKEQIAGLETKLASLKEEKHQLFLTLKKVLNEDDVRRKKESSELSSLYPQNSHPNVLPLSGHIVQPPGSSRYIQPGQSGSGEARGRSAYMKPPGGSSYHSSQQHFPYLPPLITTTATGHSQSVREQQESYARYLNASFQAGLTETARERTERTNITTGPRLSELDRARLGLAAVGKEPQGGSVNLSRSGYYTGDLH